jgi:RNA polymerase sigma-70 factor (sigma-E family)
VGAHVDFDAFVAARSQALLRTSYLLTRDHGLAEDLLQTALSKAWFRWDRIEIHPEPYVRRILVTTYASWRGRKWNGEHPTEVLPDRTDERSGSTAAPADASVQRHDLATALDRLPRRQRAVVVLRFFEDLSVAETADLMGCSTGTVKSQLSKALAHLRIDPALTEAPHPHDPTSGATR